MKIERIDHLNLTVADIDRSVEFYKRVLGMKADSMGEGRAALYFGQQKIHLDAAGGAMAISGEKRMPASSPKPRSARSPLISKPAACRSGWKGRAPAR
jgi:catechol 2,3-dioxygenase-like lactoylglutathione lyase family enzyme